MARFFGGFDRRLTSFDWFWMRLYELYNFVLVTFMRMGRKGKMGEIFCATFI